MTINKKKKIRCFLWFENIIWRIFVLVLNTKYSKFFHFVYCRKNISIWSRREIRPMFVMKWPWSFLCGMWLGQDNVQLWQTVFHVYISIFWQTNRDCVLWTRVYNVWLFELCYRPTWTLHLYISINIFYTNIFSFSFFFCPYLFDLKGRFGRGIYLFILLTTKKHMNFLLFIWFCDFSLPNQGSDCFSLNFLFLINKQKLYVRELRTQTSEVWRFDRCVNGVPYCWSLELHLHVINTSLTTFTIHIFEFL
jgi:hypothetical protein